MNYVLGIDGGGTGTTALLATPDGLVLSLGHGGPSNHRAVGIEAARFALTTAIDGALGAIARTQVSAVAAGLAGAHNEADRGHLAATIGPILPAAAVRIYTDGEVALAGGTAGRPGIMVVAGTGSIAVGRDERGRQRRCGGWGATLGDEGSAHDVVQRALRQAARAVDERAPATTLVAAFATALGVSNFHEVPRRIYGPPAMTRVDLAALAPIVVRCAAEGDATARAVLAEAGADLAGLASALARRLDLGVAPFPVVYSGGLWSAGELVIEPFQRALNATCPLAQVGPPLLIPAAGAALLALQSSHDTGLPDDVIVRRLCESYAALGVSGLQIDPATASGPRTIDDVELLPSTEERNPHSADIDTLSTIEIVRRINAEDATVASAVAHELAAIAQVVDRVAASFSAGGRLIYVGAGSSGRLGVLDAAECPPTFGTAPERVRALLAGGSAAMTAAVENAEDDVERGAREIDDLATGAHDVVIGLAASGRTPYVAAALRQARRRGAYTVALVGDAAGSVAAAAETVIAPRTGPEVLTGSTRMKAGTAQKMVLNMISTAAMIRSGHTYGNLMVDVQARNSKLRVRAGRIVAQASGRSPDEATQALAYADGEVKTAIVMLLTGTSAEQARERLARASGVVRQALTDM